MIVVIAVFLLFDLERFFTLAAVKSELAAIIAFREAHPVVLALAFFALYVAIVALALPIDLVFTLLSGALFGVVAGAVLASFASSAGATLALLATRFLFRDAVRRKFGNSLAAIDRGMQREGALYLNGRATTPAELRASVRDAVAKDPKTQAIIAGDKSVSHGRVVWVLDVVKSLGIASFAIQIDPSAMTAPGELLRRSN